jgi:hypothetical protein
VGLTQPVAAAVRSNESVLHDLLGDRALATQQEGQADEIAVALVVDADEVGVPGL